jgi:hypothetical protein
MTARVSSSAAGNVVAPAFPARPRVRASSRTRATVALLAMIAALGAFWSQSYRYKDDPHGLARPPFSLAPGAWRSILAVAATTNALCPRPLPLVVLYVSASCPHCRAELRRWSHLLQSAPQADCIAFAVVAAPSTDQAPTGWIPSRLARTLMWDRDGRVARALQVRLVPVTAYVTPQGVAVARVVGEVSEQSALQQVHALLRASNDHRGAP